MLALNNRRIAIYPSVTLAISLLLVPSLGFSLADDNKAEGDCSFIITGSVAGNVSVNCPSIPDAAIKKLMSGLEELNETFANQNDYIKLLKEKLPS